jgi:photosystem II stability/assembly factor-like uncharacterized protein
VEEIEMKTRFVATIAIASALVVTVSASASAAVPKEAWYWTMAVSPAHADVLVLGTSNGLYRSADGGKTWRKVGPAGFNATSVVNSGSRMVAAGVAKPASAIPVLNEQGRFAVAPGRGMFLVSTNEGSTWSALSPTGLPAVGVQALAVDPVSPSTLLAVVRGGALYRSTDGGTSFRKLSPKVGGTGWAVAQTDGGQLVSGDMTTGSYVSADGKSWSKTGFADSRGSKMVMEFAPQPGDPGHILMSAYGVESSSDGGKTWQPVLRSKVMFGPTAWAPGDAKIAYAVGFDRSLWRSDDGGVTWKKVS